MKAIAVSVADNASINVTVDGVSQAVSFAEAWRMARDLGKAWAHMKQNNIPSVNIGFAALQLPLTREELGRYVVAITPAILDLGRTALQGGWEAPEHAKLFTMLTDLAHHIGESEKWQGLSELFQKEKDEMNAMLQKLPKDSQGGK